MVLTGVMGGRVPSMAEGLVAGETPSAPMLVRAFSKGSEVMNMKEIAHLLSSQNLFVSAPSSLYQISLYSITVALQ